jgi:hypothetical protein
MLGTGTDAVELAFPVLFKRLDPILNGPQLVKIQVVHPALAELLYGNDADLPQDAQVLRNGRLPDSQRHYDRSHWETASPGKEVNDLPTSWVGDGVEDVGRNGDSRHEEIIFLFWNMSRGRFEMPWSTLPAHGHREFPSSRSRPFCGILMSVACQLM